MNRLTSGLVTAPVPNIPGFFGFGHAGSCQSAMEVGGDFYEVWPLSETSLILAVADVMGKGPAASLYAGTLRTLVHALLHPSLCPAQALTELNQLMFEQLASGEVFITVQLAVADLQHRQLRIANAGHCPLLISTPGQAARCVAPEGMPLGICADASYCSETVPIESYCSLIMYTDGITEARNRNGSLFGQARLERWFRQALERGCKASDFKRSLLHEMAQFQCGQPASDDQTFLILSDETPREEPLLAGNSTRWFLPWTYMHRGARSAHRFG